MTRQYAREKARLDKIRKKPPFVDGQIAAIARSNDLVLVTANRKEFERFESLELEEWAVAEGPIENG